MFRKMTNHGVSQSLVGDLIMNDDLNHGRKEILNEI